MDKSKISDSLNVAVITTRKILDGSAWIAYVSHDSEDGAWQFLNQKSTELDENDAALISLNEIMTIDSSVDELMDLPLGWCAWRDEKNTQWNRRKLN